MPMTSHTTLLRGQPAAAHRAGPGGLQGLQDPPGIDAATKVLERIRV